MRPDGASRGRSVPSLLGRGESSCCRSRHRPACSGGSSFAVPSSPRHLPASHRAASLTTLDGVEPLNPSRAGGGLLSAARAGGDAAGPRLGSGSRLLIRCRCTTSRPPFAFAGDLRSREGRGRGVPERRLGRENAPLTRKREGVTVETDAGHPVRPQTNPQTTRLCPPLLTFRLKTPTSRPGF